MLKYRTEVALRFAFRVNDQMLGFEIKFGVWPSLEVRGFSFGKKAG